jgi:hypothetical protein
MRSAPRSENGRLNVTVVVVVRTVVTPHSTSAGQDQTKGSPDRLSREISGALAMAESEQPASELSDDGASTAENDSASPSRWVKNSPLRARPRRTSSPLLQNLIFGTDSGGSVIRPGLLPGLHGAVGGRADQLFCTVF